MQKMMKCAGGLKRRIPSVLYALFLFLFAGGALILKAELSGFGYLTMQNAAFIFALLACFALNANVRQAMFSADYVLPAALTALGLTVLSSFYGTLQVLHDLPLVFAETTWSTVPLEFLAVFFLCKGLFAFFSNVAERWIPATDLATRANGTRRAFAMSFLFCMASLAGIWLCLRYPCSFDPDTVNQVQQINGNIRLLDIHTPTHTLLLMGLLRIVNNFAFVIAVQIVLFSVSWAIFGRYLCGRRGVPLLPYSLASAMFPLLTVALLYTYARKDAPYALCVAALTYLFMRLPDEDWHFTALRAAAFGLAASFAFLFRFNGIVVLLASAAFLIVYAARRRYWKQLAAFALAVLVTLGGMNAVIYGLFGFERSKNGFAVQTFIYGIASVVMEGGDITDEELDEVDELLGLYWIEANYDKAFPRYMLWNSENWEDDLEGFFDDPSHEAYCNLMIVSAGEQPLRVVGLYLRLLPRNLGHCVRALLYGFHVVWAFEGIFSHFFLLVSLGIAAAVCWSRKTLARRWAVFLPVCANVISIAVSTVTNELRYLLPTYTLFVPLLCYVLSTADARRKPGAPSCPDR